MLHRPTENMLLRDNDDGSYTASWTPAASGLYHIQVKLDDFDAGPWRSCTHTEQPSTQLIC